MSSGNCCPACHIGLVPAGRAVCDVCARRGWTAPASRRKRAKKTRLPEGDVCPGCRQKVELVAGLVPDHQYPGSVNRCRGSGHRVVPLVQETSGRRGRWIVSGGLPS